MNWATFFVHLSRIINALFFLLYFSNLFSPIAYVLTFSFFILDYWCKTWRLFGDCSFYSEDLRVNLTNFRACMLWILIALLSVMTSQTGEMAKNVMLTYTGGNMSTPSLIVPPTVQYSTIHKQAVVVLRWITNVYVLSNNSPPFMFSRLPKTWYDIIC